jgi:putative restriction endonuclease
MVDAFSSSSGWIFQGNPKRFDIDRYLRGHDFIYWGTPRHRDEFRIGDPCFIWRAGVEGGLVAVGRVAELPVPKSQVARPESLGLELYADTTDSGNDMKIGIQLEDKRFSEADGYVPRGVVKSHPILARSQIITAPQGTVFRLTPEEVVATTSLWEQRAAKSATTQSVDNASVLFSQPLPVAVPIFTTAGNPLRATCSIVGAEKDWRIMVESRGGTLGTSTERNADYSKGFAILFRRMAELEAVVTDAFVASRSLIDRGLDEADRRLASPAYPFPIGLSKVSVDDVAKALQQAQADVGTERNKGGGNTTRRVEVRLRIGSPPPEGVAVPDYLTGARSLGPITDADLSAVVLASDAAFEPRSVVDERQRVLAAITRRQGAPKFRRLLLDCYRGKCALSGCDADAVLEAAHIVPYSGQSTNHAQNGLLLRADLHTLFDRGLLGIDPTQYTVVLHPALRDTAYGDLAGQRIRLPSKQECWPSRLALELHLVGAGLKPLVNTD